ncbi:metallophosphoesterase family protein [Pedobacter sp. GR22-10]|uniref:metallophosphoesterase family protein n=1 Tax=Pedobacter sp. GR22-10 TaxID=2994472 RepID=UPI0022451AB7|nr:metallophosphoesterase [Pedobacter sp. GR22-10]MCX2432185.1 metallophosphoesterase [Pedobacter sp. GR22-10]
MADRIIIHLSDLHVSYHRDNNGVPLNKVGSNLSTDSKLTDNNKYAEQFCKLIQEEYPDAKKYLVITGDIADQAKPEEYQAAAIFLESLIEQLKLERSDLLIIPGDHDINRLSLQVAYLGSDKSKPAFEMNEAKFSDFSKFYAEVLKMEFPVDNMVCQHLVLEAEKLLLVGLNSNAMIGAHNGLGYIHTDKLSKELAELENKFTEYSKVAFVHHNLDGQYENKKSGQWDATNKVDLIQVFGQYKFNAVFYGNEHTPASNRENNLLYISTGSFAKNDATIGFRVYKIEAENGGLSLSNTRYSLINDNAKTAPKWGNWSPVIIRGANENLPEIELRKPLAIVAAAPPQDIFGNADLVKETVEKIEEVVEESQESAEAEKEASAGARAPELNFENSYSDKIFSIIKEKKLFLSGHFHWSDSSKAHNWINVPVFLSDMEHLQLAQKAVYEVVMGNDLKYDFVLGLGIEGNILATYTALRSGTTYSYLPYSYRYQDHAVYEKNIHLENNGNYLNVLVITDVINNGKTVERLIAAETDFFKDVKSINVVSLFYTGDPLTNPLNCDEKTNVRNFYVTHMKVEKCPYDENFRKTCMIYREKMDCVHEFYDANKEN